MAAPVEVPDEPAHTGELVRRLREAAGLSVEQVAVRAGITGERLRALETGQGVSELGYDDVCAPALAVDRSPSQT